MIKRIFEKLNNKIKTLNVIDIGLVKWSVLFATIIIVKLFPQILKIDYRILIILMVVCSARPFCKIWFKK